VLKRNLLVLVILLSSCTIYTTLRMPAQVTTKSDLRNLLNLLKVEVDGPVESTKDCARRLDAFYQRLFRLKGSDVALNDLTGEDLKDMVELSFETRIVIKNRMNQLTVIDNNGLACLTKIRDTFRALRTMEDYLVELYIFNEKKLERNPQNFTTFKGESPFFLVNKNFADSFEGVEDLESGDVILSRGNAYSSAAIARIGETDTNFSHLSFVYEDPNQKQWTTEAHIEIGNIVMPIETHIEQRNARSVLFRYEDTRMADRASECIFNKVREQQETGTNIQYDFEMNYKDDKRIFCSEVIYKGFQCASGGKIDVPLYKTKFKKTTVPFLQTLGLKLNESNVESFDTFGPGDIEYDHRFKLVAEWRNPAKMEDSRMKDAILTKLFEWMEDYGYRFKPPFNVKTKANLAWVMRRFPINSLKEKFPLNMKSAQLDMFFTLDMVGEKLQARLVEKQHEAARPLTPIEMYDILEDYRLQDLSKYRKRKRSSEWIRYFRPKR